MTMSILLLAIALQMSGLLLVGQDAVGRLEVDHGELRFPTSDGRMLTGPDLVGARVTIRLDNEAVEIKLQEFDMIRVGQNGWLSFYRILAKDASRSQYQEVCDADALGRRLGLFLEKDGNISVTCSSGAEGKCIMLGYLPWSTDTSVPMTDLHEACVRVIRADYGGDGSSYTRNGRTIDVYDRYGIQKKTAAENMSFEAVWGKEGALCVARPRVPGDISLDALAERYPRLKRNIGSRACAEHTRYHDPDALIFNRSIPE